MKVRIPNRFAPRTYQRGYMGYHDAGGKRSVWVVHRRGGKDLTAMHQTHKQMWRRVGAYWHVYPTAEWGRKAVWTEFTRDGQRIMEQVFPRALRKSPAEWTPNQAMVVELRNGSVWRLIGSDKLTVVGAGPVGVVFSEFAQAKPKAWDLIRPMLMERDGWASFISTPRGRNHFHALYEMAGKTTGWWRQLLTVHDTGGYPGMPPAAILEAERQSGMPDELIRQEYLCDWTAALIGSVWGRLIEKLELAGLAGVEFEHDALDVHTHWDLGIDDATAVWWWRFAEDRSVEVLDYYESHGKPMSHYFDEVERRGEENGWKYAKHWLPHDARARTLATGVSILELCIEKWGVELVEISPKLSPMDGIQAGRWLLQRHPRFHARCKEGIEALRQYHYAWDEDAKIFSSEPVHDWSSHGADAWRYLAVTARALEEMTRPKPPTPQQPVAVPLSSITMDQAWKWLKADRGRRGGGRI